MRFQISGPKLGIIVLPTIQKEYDISASDMVKSLDTKNKKPETNWSYRHQTIFGMRKKKKKRKKPLVVKKKKINGPL